jgi:chemotaxis protein methyltransferase CheR
VSDRDCTAFLQWALPQLGFRWPGFRKVRRQVCKRLKRRMSELELDDFAAYRARLEADTSEWPIVDDCCHITISRFFRGKGKFELLRSRILPEIAARARREERHARIWSAGCASGEEPYTLKILWDLEVARACPEVALSIIATDIDQTVLARAREGCFESTSLRELPPQLVEQAFDRAGDLFCVQPQHRDGITFVQQDMRSEAPPDQFDLIVCCNVAFTYFALPLQQEVLARIVARLLPGGHLVIGEHEQLPGGSSALERIAGATQIFRKGPASH